VRYKPRIVDASDDQDGQFDGCLSCSDVRERVRRPPLIEVEHTTLYGDKCIMTLERGTSRVWALKINRPHGILYADKFSSRGPEIHPWRAQMALHGPCTARPCSGGAVRDLFTHRTPFLLLIRASRGRAPSSAGSSARKPMQSRADTAKATLLPQLEEHAHWRQIVSRDHHRHVVACKPTVMSSRSWSVNNTTSWRREVCGRFRFRAGRDQPRQQLILRRSIDVPVATQYISSSCTSATVMVTD
jgi:hypothetical protein